MKHLIYFSRATEPMEADALRQLLEEARAHNGAHHITGLLLYQAGYFLQALEGDAAEVVPLFQRIQKDPRHQDVVTLYDQDVEERNFADWHMGFHVVHSEALQDCPGYSEVLSGEVPTNEIDLANEMTFSLVSLFKQYVRAAQRRLQSS